MPGKRRVIGSLFIVVLLVLALPLGVYLSSKRQIYKSKASSPGDCRCSGRSIICEVDNGDGTTRAEWKGDDPSCTEGTPPSFTKVENETTGEITTIIESVNVIGNNAGVVAKPQESAAPVATTPPIENVCFLPGMNCVSDDWTYGVELAKKPASALKDNKNPALIAKLKEQIKNPEFAKNNTAVVNALVEQDESLKQTVGTQTSALISDAAKKLLEEKNKECSQTTGLCPMIDPDTLAVVGWVPSDKAVFGNYQQAIIARSNLSIGDTTTQVKIGNKTYTLANPNFKFDITAEEAIKIKELADKQKIGSDTNNRAVLDPAKYDLGKIQKQLEDFEAQRIEAENAIKDQILQTGDKKYFEYLSPEMKKQVDELLKKNADIKRAADAALRGDNSAKDKLPEDQQAKVEEIVKDAKEQETYLKNKVEALAKETDPEIRAQILSGLNESQKKYVEEAAAQIALVNKQNEEIRQKNIDIVAQQIAQVDRDSTLSDDQKSAEFEKVSNQLESDSEAIKLATSKAVQQIIKEQETIKIQEQKIANIKIDLDLAKQATSGNKNFDDAVKIITGIANGEIKTDTLAKLIYGQITQANNRPGDPLADLLSLRPGAQVAKLTLSDPTLPQNQKLIAKSLDSPALQLKLKENYYTDLVNNYYSASDKSSCVWGVSSSCEQIKEKIDKYKADLPPEQIRNIYKQALIKNITNLDNNSIAVKEALVKTLSESRIGDLESDVDQTLIETTNLGIKDWQDYQKLNDNWTYLAYSYGSGQQFSNNIQQAIESGQIKPAEVEKRIIEIAGSDPVSFILAQYEVARKEYISKNQKDPGYNPTTKEYWEASFSSLSKAVPIMAATGYNIFTQGGAQRNLASQSPGYEQIRQQYIKNVGTDPGYDPTKLTYWFANFRALGEGVVNTVPVVTNGVVDVVADQFFNDQNIADKYIPVTEYQRNSADYVRAGVAFAAPAASVIAPIAALPFAPLGVVGILTTGQTAFGSYASLGSLGNTAELCTFRPDMDRVGCGLAFGNTVYMVGNTISGLARGTISIAEAQVAKDVALVNKNTTFQQALKIVKGGASVKASALNAGSPVERIAYSLSSGAGAATFIPKALLSCTGAATQQQGASWADCIVSSTMGAASVFRSLNLFLPFTRNDFVGKTVGYLAEGGDMLDGFASCADLSFNPGNKDSIRTNPGDCILGLYDAFGDNLAKGSALFGQQDRTVTNGSFAKLQAAVAAKDEALIKQYTAEAISNLGHLQANNISVNPDLSNADAAIDRLKQEYQKQFLLNISKDTKNPEIEKLRTLLNTTTDFPTVALDLTTAILTNNPKIFAAEDLTQLKHELETQVSNINTQVDQVTAQTTALQQAAETNPDFAPQAQTEINRLQAFRAGLEGLRDKLFGAIAVVGTARSQVAQVPPPASAPGASSQGLASSPKYVVRGFGLYELGQDNLYHAMGPSTEGSRKVEAQLNQDRIANNTQPLTQSSLQQPAPVPQISLANTAINFAKTIIGGISIPQIIQNWRATQTQPAPVSQPSQASEFEYPDTHLGRLLKTLAAKDTPPVTITISNHSREAADEAVALGIKAFKQPNETSAQFWERVQREYREKITQQRNKAPVATMPQTQKIELSLLEKIQSEFDKASIRSNAKKLGIPDTDLKALFAAIDADPKGCFMCSLVVKTQLDKLAKAQNAEAVNGVQEYLKKESELSESTNQDVFRMLVAQANARQNYLAAQPAPIPEQPQALSQQKTRFRESFDKLRTFVSKPELSPEFISQIQSFVNRLRGVDSRGVEPLQPELTVRAPHRREPTPVISIANRVMTVIAPHIPLIDKVLGEIGSQALGRFGNFVGPKLEQGINTITQAFARQGLENKTQKPVDFVEYFLNGKKYTDPSLPQKLLSDHFSIKQKYGLPIRDMRFDDPNNYIQELKNIAKRNGIPIRDKSEFQQFFNENPIVGALYDEIGRQIYLDLSKDPISLAGDFEHELIHALQHLRYPGLPIELQEYEAYVGANMKFGDNYLYNQQNVANIFSHIGSSAKNWYENKKLPVPWETTQQPTTPQAGVSIQELGARIVANAIPFANGWNRAIAQIRGWFTQKTTTAGQTRSINEIPNISQNKYTNDNYLPFDQTTISEGIEMYTVFLNALPEKIRSKVILNYNDRRHSLLPVFLGLTPETSIYNSIRDSLDNDLERLELDKIFDASTQSKIVRIRHNVKNYISLLNLSSAQKIASNYPDLFPIDKNNPNQWFFDHNDEWITAGDDINLIRHGILSGFPRDASEKFIVYTNALSKIWIDYGSRPSQTENGVRNYLTKNRVGQLISRYVFGLSSLEIEYLNKQFDVPFVIGRFEGFIAEDKVWSEKIQNILSNAMEQINTPTQPAPAPQAQIGVSRQEIAARILKVWNIDLNSVLEDIRNIITDNIFDPGFASQLSPQEGKTPEDGAPLPVVRSSQLSALISAGAHIIATIDLPDVRAQNDVSRLNGDYYFREKIRTALRALPGSIAVRIDGDKFVFVNFTQIANTLTEPEFHILPNDPVRTFSTQNIDISNFFVHHPEFTNGLDPNLQKFLTVAFEDKVLNNPKAFRDYKHMLVHLQASGQTEFTVVKIDTPVYTKTKNDIEGERAGDETIRQLAALIPNATIFRDGAVIYFVIPKGTPLFPIQNSTYTVTYPNGEVFIYPLVLFTSSSEFTLSAESFNQARSTTSNDIQTQIDTYVKSLSPDDPWLRNIYYNPLTSRGLANLRAAGKTKAEIEALKSHYRSAGKNTETKKEAWVWNDQRNVEIINTLSLDPGLMRNIDPDAILKTVNGDTALAAIIENNLRTLQPLWNLMQRVNIASSHSLDIWLEIANNYNNFKFVYDGPLNLNSIRRSALFDVRQDILSSVNDPVLEDAITNEIVNKYMTKQIIDARNQIENIRQHLGNQGVVRILNVLQTDPVLGIQMVQKAVADQAVKSAAKQAEDAVKAEVSTRKPKPQVAKATSLTQKLLDLIPSPAVRRNALIAITTVGVISVAVITAIQGYIPQPVVQPTDQFVPQYVARPDERNTGPIVSPIVVDSIKPTTESERVYRLSDIPDIKDRLDSGCFVKKRLQVNGSSIDIITYPNSDPRLLSEYCQQNIKFYDELGPSKIAIDQTRLNTFKNIGDKTNLPMIKQLPATCYLFSSFMGIDILYQQIGEEDGVITMLDPLLVGELTDLTVESFENMYQSSLRDRQMIRTYVVDNNLRDTLIKNPELVETYLNDNRLNDLKSAARFGTVNTQLVSGKKWDNFLLKLGITNRSGGAISISTDDLVSSRQSIKNYVKNNVNPNDVVYLTLVADASGIAHSYIVVGHETKNNKDYLHLIEAHGGDNGPTTWAYYNDIKELKDHSLLLSVDDVIKNFAGFKIMTRTPAGQAMVDNKINSKVVSTQPIETPVIEFSKTLGSIINTYETLNNISELPSAYIVRELAKTQYANVISRPEFKEALNFVDKNIKRVPGQPIQCVGWTNLIEASGLGSGILVTNKAGHAINRLPKASLGGSKLVDAGGSEIFRIDNINEIETNEEGRVFIVDDGTPEGHIGKMWRKDGKIVISESNRNLDGRPMTYEIDEKDFEKKIAPFGKIFVERPYSSRAIAMVP